MNNTKKQEMNEQIDDYLEKMRTLSGSLACIGKDAVYSINGKYSEPSGISIDATDKEYGDPKDAPDPLTTAHRLAKFYIISAGDNIFSLSKLLSSSPSLSGSVSVARSAVEHDSRSVFLTDPKITPEDRMFRAMHLLSSGEKEYPNKNTPASAEQQISRAKAWIERVKKEGHTDKKDNAKNNKTSLIKDAFPELSTKVSYADLSRPTHGNSVWAIITVVQEQKGTPFAKIQLAKTLIFALNAHIKAVENVAELWKLDLDASTQKVFNKHGKAYTWDNLKRTIENLGDNILDINEEDYVDLTPDPQPKR